MVAPGAVDEDKTVETRIAARARPEETPRRSAGVRTSARVIRVRGPASPYDPSYHLLVDTGKIRRLVAQERPEVLEIHSPYMAAASALRATAGSYGIRTFQWHSDFIDTYGGVLESALPSFAGNARAKVVRTITDPLWWLVRSIARRCDAVLVASKWQVDKLVAHGVPHVVHRPFGIERAVFGPRARTAEGRRELLRLAGRDPEDPSPAVLVGLGRFAIEKRWDVVIDAFVELRARGRDAILVLFGDGPERARMRERAAGSFEGDIVFPGFSKDREGLARSLASADALVHGCPFETFGLSIAEAMSSGLPVVVPDEGGAAEMHDPASGERYRAGDATACALATERLLTRLAEDGGAIRDAAARTAAKLPTVEEQFAGQIELYADLLERRGHPVRQRA